MPLLDPDECADPTYYISNFDDNIAPLKKMGAFFLNNFSESFSELFSIALASAFNLCRLLKKNPYDFFVLISHLSSNKPAHFFNGLKWTTSRSCIHTKSGKLPNSIQF